MAKRVPSLVLAFLLAGLTARAGLATAGAPTNGPSTGPTGPDLPDVDDLEPPKSRQPRDVPAPVERTAHTSSSWPELIAGRLGALTAPAYTDGNEDPGLHAALSPWANPAGRALAIHVRDLESGAVLFDRRGAQAFVPASNQKLVTATAALELLGPDYRFETKVLREGNTLYLVGEGDPHLMEDHLYALAERTIAEGGLEGVTEIVIDDTAFDARQFGPGYDPEGEGLSYMAPSGALSMTFNTVEIQVRPGPALLDPGRVTIMPASTAVVVRNETRTGHGRAVEATSAAVDGRTQLELSGNVGPVSRPVKIRRRVGDPGLFTGGAFAQMLSQQSAHPPLPVRRDAVPTGASLVASHHSAPLAEVLDSAMKYSNNFTSEQILRTLGWRMSGEPGSWKNGTRAIREFWSAVAHDADQAVVVNGSGLSRRGRATARALVDVLALTHRQGSSAASLAGALAESGAPGTLKNRLPFAGAHLRGKTGTLAGVTALSGVITSRDGTRQWGFSILINGGRAEDNRQTQDRLVAAMMRQLG